MVFNETLLQYNEEVGQAVKELFDLAENNQKHENDILLIHLNGWKNQKLEQGLRNNNYSPFMIGPGELGHCFHSIYELYDNYRRNIYNKSEITVERQKEEDFINQEKASIDIELLIYLKFWEADLILFKLYNLSQLAQGKPYDWELLNTKKISNRRKLVRNNIQAPIKDICPKFFQLIDETYSRQIRNAIAHSKYFHLYKTIYLANLSENEYYKLSNLKYENWEIIFHKILLLFNHIIQQTQSVNERKIAIAKNKHNGLPINIPEKDKYKLNKVFWIKYDNERKDWIWNNKVKC